MGKYDNRPSPGFSAADHPGAIAQGNLANDFLFISTPNKKGIFAWKKLARIDKSSPANNSLTTEDGHKYTRFDHDDRLLKPS